MYAVLDFPTQETRRFFFAMQPLFDAKHRVWGHELVVRGNLWTPCRKVEKSEQVDDCLVETYVKTLRSRIGDKMVLVPCPEDQLVRRLPKSLNARHTVVSLDESTRLDSDSLRGLLRLKREKYLISVANYEGRQGSEELLELADIVKIDIMDKRPEEVLHLMAKIPKNDAVLIASGIDGREMYKLAKALGFGLFQGSFFKKPEISTDRKLSASEAAKLKLVKLTSINDPDFNEIAKAIGMDPAVSYRLLLFLNSAYFGFSKEVSSILYAVVMLGWEQLKNWLRMTILTELTPAEKTLELMKTASLRGKFFELCGKNLGEKPEGQEQLFMLGLFSLLEPLLDMPMHRIVKDLPVSGELKNALCHQPNRHRLWIDLARNIEDADWDEVDRIIDKMGVDGEMVAKCYYEAHSIINAYYDMSSQN